MKHAYSPTLNGVADTLSAAFEMWGALSVLEAAATAFLHFAAALFRR